MSAVTQPAPAATGAVTAPLLSIEGLVVDFLTPAGPVNAVDGVSIAVAPGRTLGIVGESGSGKTVCTLAALGLLPGRTPMEVRGKAIFDGVDLLSISPRQRRAYLGRDIGVIFQDPVSALNPVQRIGTQLIEALQLQDRRLSRRAATERSVELLTEVGVPDPRARLEAYPHQFSGGMCQRVVIAIAMANRPRLLVADEPTTAVDATVQAQLLELLQHLQSETGTAVVMITHDLGVVAQVADSICLMYAGRVMEHREAEEFLTGPQHPYGLGLLASRPGASLAGRRLAMIPGGLPDPTDMPPGCRFRPRCFRGQSEPLCAQHEPALSSDGRSAVACHFPGPIRDGEQLVTLPPAGGSDGRSDSDESGDNDDAVGDGDAAAPGRLLKVRGLSKHFPIRSAVLRRPVGRIAAVDGIDLDLSPGETLGLVGESGCGKSTTGRLLLRLLEPTAGEIDVNGLNLRELSTQELRRARPGMQMVFQDPLGSLNPRLSAAENIADPLRATGMPVGDRRRRVAELMDQVGLRTEWGSRMPTEFSGGQRQRIGIARALSVQPAVMVLDEPVASLDVSVQAQIINLLADLQAEYGTGYVFISHDLAVVRHVSTRTAVMYLGRIVEVGPTEELFSGPAHPYTEALISAAPRIGTPLRERIVLAGEPPSPAQRFHGCRFRGRCPRATEICAEQDPPLLPLPTVGRSVACHHPTASEVSS